MCKGLQNCPNHHHTVHQNPVSLSIVLGAENIMGILPHVSYIGIYASKPTYIGTTYKNEFENIFLGTLPCFYYNMSLRGHSGLYAYRVMWLLIIIVIIYCD